MTSDFVHQSVPDDLPGPREVVEVVTTYLEMRARPSAPLAPPAPGVTVVRAVKPSVRFYRYLYDSVGAPWHWYDRRRMPAAELAAILDDDRVEVHVAYQGGVPAGYTELDRRASGEVELAYFGLVPEAIGHKLGPWLLAWSIHEAWRPTGVSRVWVHTCTLDHPAALRTYLAAGFTKYGDDRHRQTVLASPAGRGSAPSPSTG
jgi:GNAT superfamily N-acetyltransferase